MVPVLTLATALAAATAVGESPRILVSDSGSSCACASEIDCHFLVTTVEDPADVDWVMISFDDVPSVRGARFGLRVPDGYGVTQVSWCRVGSVTLDPVGDVLGISYVDDAPARALVIPLGCIRVTAPSTGVIEVVPHPTYGVVDVTSTSGGTVSIPPENRGWLGVGGDGYLPCSGPTPTEHASWTAVKALYR